MKPEVKKLAAALRQIAHDAGHALLCRGDLEVARFCVAQYNRIYARLSELDPDLTAPFGSLPEDALAGEVRVVARALAAYVTEKTHAERKHAWAGADCVGFVWPGCSLKFDLC